MDFGQQQGAWLLNHARATARYGPLVCFYAIQRDYNGLAAVDAEIAAADSGGRLIYDLLTMGFDESALPVVQERIAADGTPWMTYTLTKYLLARGRLEEALALVPPALQRDRQSLYGLNLICKYLAAQGDSATARRVAEQSLRLNPEQHEIAELRDTGRWDHPLYLELCPRREAVSFYLPVYNVEKHLRGAIESLLGQSYPLQEILVVNDGSTDGSMAIAAEYPVRIVEHEENRGLAAARSTALLHAAGTYVGAIDTDAVADPDYTLHALMEIENGPGYFVGVGGEASGAP